MNSPYFYRYGFNFKRFGRKLLCLLHFHDYAYMGQICYFDTWIPLETCFYCQHWRAAKHVRPQKVFAYKENELPD